MCAHSVVPNCLWLQGLQCIRLLCPWDSPSKNTVVSCHFLLQGIFPIQGSNLHLLFGRQIFLQLSHLSELSFHLTLTKSQGWIRMMDVEENQIQLFKSPSYKQLWSLVDFVDLCFTTRTGEIAEMFGSVQSLSGGQLLWPHRPQHARLPCPSPTHRAYSNSFPLSW